MAMSRNDLKEKLADVLKLAMPNAEFDVTTMSEELSLVDDLGLSSVGVLYVVIAIEEFFNIRFDNVGFADFKTVADVLDYIQAKLEQ